MKENNLVYKLYVPEIEAKAAVVVVHGMQEHQLRYKNFAQELNKHGIAVFTFDLPGHGKSCDDSSLLGYFGENDGWNTLVESAHSAVTEMRKKYPDVPLWYFGHSMGSMIGRCFLQEYDQEIDGMILSGVVASRPEAKAAQVLVRAMAIGKKGKGHSKLLDQLMVGGYNKAIENPRTNLDWLSYNKKNVDGYIADPLCGNPFTIQGYSDLIDGMVRMADASKYEVSYPELPMLLLGGKDDPCIGDEDGFESSVSFLKNLGYQNIISKTYPNMRHEILNEIDGEKVVEDIIEFIDSHYTK